MKSQIVCALWVDHLLQAIKLEYYSVGNFLLEQYVYETKVRENGNENTTKEPLKALCNRKRIIAISPRSEAD